MKSEISRHFQNLLRHQQMFHFEPRVASAVYTQMLHEAGQEVILCQYLDRVEKDGKKIRAITTLSDLRVEAKVFIDATYEGDLMAKAGVTYTVGRESNEVYGETLNGIQVQNKHQFSHAVDPYVKEGDPSSGLLPNVVAEDLSAKQGAGRQACAGVLLPHVHDG